MKHPSQAEWMDYLYDETSAESKTALEAHLKSCVECQNHLSNWKQTMSALDTWKLPKKPLQVVVAKPLKWAIAAVFVLGFGFGLGRFSVPAVNAEKLRASIEQSLKTQLAQQLKTEFREELQSKLAANNQRLTDEFRQQMTNAFQIVAAGSIESATARAQTMLSAYDEKNQADLRSLVSQISTVYASQTKQSTELASLQRALEVVAVLTETGFRHAEQQLVQLASYTEPSGLEKGTGGQIP